LAAAVISAALADPVVEFASNAGWFGPGNFTDRSYLDVVPAFAVGVGILVSYLLAKAPLLVAGRALPRPTVTLLPWIFALQLLALYAMETTEQCVVRGHVLGPIVWLGGPVLVGLAVHAAFCITITLAMARSARRLAEAALRVVALIRAIGTFAVGAPAVSVPRALFEPSFREFSPVLCGIGERAPPPLPT
jgi:hypothetical protein